MLDREISIAIRVCGFVRKQQVRSLRYIEDKFTHTCVVEVAGPGSFMYRNDTESCSGSPKDLPCHYFDAYLFSLGRERTRTDETGLARISQISSSVRHPRFDHCASDAYLCAHYGTGWSLGGHPR